MPELEAREVRLASIAQAASGGTVGGFRAVALDYDGTLTEADRPDEGVLDAVADLRRAGMKMLLVTGILTELEDVFPDVRERFDLVVCENGAVVAGPGWSRSLGTPVDAALVQALRARAVPFRRGQVLLACEAADDFAVLEEVRRLGFDYQLVRNRGALMVLPPEVSKSTGLYEALGDLRLSYHSAIAIGDAENDHSLLARCEVGVAVANAMDALKRLMPTSSSTGATARGSPPSCGGPSCPARSASTPGTTASVSEPGPGASRWTSPPHSSTCSSPAGAAAASPTSPG